METVATAADFVDGGKCYAQTSVPSLYKNGKVNNYTEGLCGFKYQITNANAAYPNTFKVLKDGAAQLLAGSFAALVALMAF